jgi:flagellar motor switch protein FliN
VAAQNDDLLDPSEIESLLSAAGASVSPSGGTATKGTSAAAAEARPAKSPVSGPEALLDQAQADLMAAVAPDVRSTGAGGARLTDAQPYAFQPFDSSIQEGAKAELGALKDIELDLRIELGRTELLIDEVLKLREGSVVPLDKLAGDPVDILVNGRLIARGEVLVLNDNFCVRVAEILAPTRGPDE